MPPIVHEADSMVILSYPHHLSNHPLRQEVRQTVQNTWHSISTCRKECLVEDIFNPEAFVHARRFRSDADLIRYLMDLANDPDRQLQMLNAPIFRDEQIIQRSHQKLVDFFAAIFERGPHDIRRTRAQHLKARLAKYYGHGLFRTLRRISRYLRGK